MGNAYVSGSLKRTLTRRVATCVHEHVAERNANVRFTADKYAAKQNINVHSTRMACLILLKGWRKNNGR